MYGCPSLLLDKSVFELFETISVHLLVVPIFRDVVSLIIFIFHFSFYYYREFRNKSNAKSCFNILFFVVHLYYFTSTYLHQSHSYIFFFLILLMYVHILYILLLIIFHIITTYCVVITRTIPVYFSCILLF